MECPVCRAAAKNASPPTYNGLVVDCRGCGIYRVTKGALDKLLDLRTETRLAALKAAKELVSAKVVPTITSGLV